MHRSNYRAFKGDSVCMAASALDNLTGTGMATLASASYNLMARIFSLVRACCLSRSIREAFSNYSCWVESLSSFRRNASSFESWTRCSMVFRVAACGYAKWTVWIVSNSLGSLLCKCCR